MRGCRLRRTLVYLPLVLEVVVTGGGKVEGADPASEPCVILQAAVRRPEGDTNLCEIVYPTAAGMALSLTRPGSRIPPGSP